MKREFRLTRSKDFKRVKKTGKSLHHPLVVLVFAESECVQPRIAVVASKAIGGAVARNYIKRRLKSCIRDYVSRIKNQFDLVFYARHGILGASYTEICSAIDFLLNKADILEN